MKKIVLILIMVLALTAFGCASQEQQPKETAAEAPAVNETIAAFGVVKAINVYNININLPAVIREIAVKEGQQVAKGDILAVLDLSDYQSDITSKRIELKMARIELEKAIGSVKKTGTEYDFAKASYEKASVDLAVKKKLYGQGAITKDELDEVKKSLDVKEQELKTLEVALENISKQDIDLRRQKIYLLNNELEQMGNKLEEAVLEEDKVVAQLESGIVSNIGYRPGDSLVSGRPILSLLDASILVIEAEVAEEFIREVKEGAAVAITPLSDPANKFEGKVSRIYEQAVFKNGETIVPVEITFDNQGYMLPGFNVDVSIHP